MCALWIDDGESCASVGAGGVGVVEISSVKRG